MDVREVLNYSRSKKFIRPERVNDLPANELAFALRLASTECVKPNSPIAGVQFDGAYVLQREPATPAIPVVFVFHTDSENTAKRVHQFVWNQNQSPFLIVESPTKVRVYPGFSFNRGDDDSIISVAKGTADALDQLAAFRAESIDDGTVWRQWSHAVDPSKRVDQSLLRDLEDLDKRLQSQGVGRTASHGLIGKFVYLWYLRDRTILSDEKLAKWHINPDELFTRNASLQAFHKVNHELQVWLNGSVFSLGEAELTSITEAQLRLVAGVYRGDSPVGKELVQPSLFELYDFSHIPIETLSCVYEQFLHDAKESDGSSRGKTLGAYYTPLPLAEYVLSELENRKPLAPEMKVLDPAQGSGAFLVQCYRRLIEKQRRAEGRDLRKTELRDLLTESIFGVDRDDDACRVAELSLILTLLDYVEPKDLENTNFKLPCLRGQNIFKGDFFDESGPVHALLAKQKFDWIVGNPPWAEVKKTPATNHEHFVVHQWMKAHKTSHPTSGNQIAEAFIWKAGECLAPNGVCGLVVLAMTWFKKEAISFRQRFFAERRVWCLANFANLAYVLFAGRSERPASVIFFDSLTPDDDHVVLTFAPFVAEQIANRPEKSNRRFFTWSITVSGLDMREIANADAKQGDSLTWKLAMWGTSRDQRLLERLESRFKDSKLDALHQLGIESPHQGLDLRSAADSSKEEIEHHPELQGKLRVLFLKLNRVGRIFSFPPYALDRIAGDDCYVRLRGGMAGLAVSNPPHIVLDASRRFAVFSDEFIAIPPRQIGIAGNAQSETALRALSLYLSSDYFRYHQFFHAAQWGIDENRADLETLKNSPIPILRLSPAELSEWAEMQKELAVLSKRQFEDSESSAEVKPRLEVILGDLNERVFKLLGLRPTERWLVEDFVNLQMELIKGKVTNAARKQPTPDDRAAYLVSLRHCLDGFLSADRGLRHKLEVLVGRDSAMLSVSLIRSNVAVEPIVHTADDAASKDLKTIRDRLRSQHSQWVYFDRALKVYERGVLYQFKPLQRLHWTRRQAVLDADDIIAETLAEGGRS